jgi:hypothetical protein
VQQGNPFLGFILASAGKLEERLERDGGNLKIGTGFARAVETVRKRLGRQFKVI